MSGSSLKTALAHGRAFAHIAAFHPELTAFRRDLHAHPELGFEEVYASARVIEGLKVCGVDAVSVAMMPKLISWAAAGNERASAASAARADRSS